MTAFYRSILGDFSLSVLFGVTFLILQTCLSRAALSASVSWFWICCFHGLSASLNICQNRNILFYVSMQLYSAHNLIWSKKSMLKTGSGKKKNITGGYFWYPESGFGSQKYITHSCYKARRLLYFTIADDRREKGRQNEKDSGENSGLSIDIYTFFYSIFHHLFLFIAAMLSAHYR